jgi:transcriptional regulator with XRE-family HTH domain
MTPKELKQARRALGLSIVDFCAAFGVGNERTLRAWESGYRGDQQVFVPKPVQILVKLALELEIVRERLADMAGFPKDHESHFDE